MALGPHGQASALGGSQGRPGTWGGGSGAGGMGTGGPVPPALGCRLPSNPAPHPWGPCRAPAGPPRPWLWAGVLAPRSLALPQPRPGTPAWALGSWSRTVGPAGCPLCRSARSGGRPGAQDRTELSRRPTLFGDGDMGVAVAACLSGDALDSEGAAGTWHPPQGHPDCGHIRDTSLMATGWAGAAVHGADPGSLLAGGTFTPVMSDPRAEEPDSALGVLTGTFSGSNSHPLPVTPSLTAPEGLGAARPLGTGHPCPLVCPQA